MIVQLTVEAEYNDNGIVRVGVAPTAQSPWVIVMILDAVMRHIERELLVGRLDAQRQARELGQRIFPPGRN